MTMAMSQVIALSRRISTIIRIPTRFFCWQPSEQNVTRFDTRAYLNERFGTSNCNVKDEGYQSMHPFFMECYHAFFQKYKSTWNAETARLLEYAGGPVVYYLGSAAPHVKEVVFSDYLEANREAVKQWKENHPSAFDWSPYFRYIVNTLEQEKGEAAVNERMDAVRHRISSIVPCDIEKPYPLAYWMDPFQIVMCNLSFCGFSNSEENFGSNLKKLSQLVMPGGGYLVTIMSLERTWGEIGGCKVDVLYLTSEVIHRSLKDAGFTVLEAHQKAVPPSSNSAYNDTKAMEFVISQKA